MELLQGIFKFKNSFVLITSYFNCGNSNWPIPRARVKASTPFCELKQLIKTLTHILQNSDTCIDLVFTKEPHLVMESGVDSFPCSKCYHQFVFAKVNLKLEYLLPYERKHLNYNKAERFH